MTAAEEWAEGTVHPTGDYDRVSDIPAQNQQPDWAIPRTKSYFRGDDFHRLDGPAVEELAEDGFVLTESFYVDGRLHREGAPARVQRRGEDRSVYFEEWFLHGETHREGGPAQIFYRTDGGGSVAYYRHGRYHRTDGPALARTEGGIEVAQDAEFYVDDDQLTAGQFARFREAHEGGAPEAWCLAYAKGEVS